jgi:predicted nucleic acid-binding protein
MSVKQFVDANIWLYAFMDGDAHKQSVAQILIRRDMQHNQRIEFLTICNPFKS